MRLALAAAIVLLLSACCLQPEPETRITLIMDGVPPADWSDLATSAQAHVAEFESRYGRLEPVRIRIRPSLIPCSTLPFLVRGCYHRRMRLVDVWQGDWDEVPALYHELAHHYMGRVDADHEDPRWGDWDAEGRAIAQRLR